MMPTPLDIEENNTVGSSSSKPTFVLVHGGMHGGWCWRLVSDALRGAGLAVFTPTLTGLGERAHLLNASVSIETWIDDIIGVLEYEELTNVVLVGHSFGGLIISGVADKIPQRMRELVYLDAALVPSGSNLFAEMPEDEAQRRERIAAGSTTIQPFSPEAFGVTDHRNAAWLERRLTPHPVRTFTDPIRLDHPLGNGLPSTYIACTNPLLSALQGSRQRAKEMAGWKWKEIPTGHDPMITAPELVIDLLLGIVADDSAIQRPL